MMNHQTFGQNFGILIIFLERGFEFSFGYFPRFLLPYYLVIVFVELYIQVSDDIFNRVLMFLNDYIVLLRVVFAKI